MNFKHSLTFTDDGFLIPQKEPYEMTLDEVKSEFGHQTHTRRNIMDGLMDGANNLFAANVERVIIGGSFISRKHHPSDVDGCWYAHPDIDWNTLDPAFLNSKRIIKAKFCMDFRIEGVLNSGRLTIETHEDYLRTNSRLPLGSQSVGIVHLTR